MESITQVFEEMKDAYRRVTGAEPVFPPGAGTAFPPGVDPTALVMAEVQAVRSLTAASLVPGATWVPSLGHPTPPVPPAWNWASPSTPAWTWASPSAPTWTWAPPSAQAWSWAPPADIWISDHELVMAIELAGCDPSDVRVSVLPGLVEVTGTLQSRATETTTKNYLGRERPVGTFLRRLPVPADADLASAGAKLTGGVLELRMRLGAVPDAGARREVTVVG
jgi:HSP20 family molecular chaperone IbpA